MQQNHPGEPHPAELPKTGPRQTEIPVTGQWEAAEIPAAVRQAPPGEALPALPEAEELPAEAREARLLPMDFSLWDARMYCGETA